MTIQHDPSMFSHSAQSRYRDCQLQYRYERMLHLVPRTGGVSHDLHYGSSGHLALAALYEGRSLKDVGNVFKEAYPLDTYPDPLPSYAQGKTQANFLAALWQYINTQYREDCERWEVLEVERVQTTDGLGDYDHMLVLDLVVRDRQDGMVYGVDHKISGKYMADIWGAYENSSQIRMYVDQLKRRFGQVGGFIINAFSLRHRSRAYTPRTGPDKGVQQAAGDWFSFGRMTYLPNEDLLEMERANVRATVDSIRHSIATDHWTYNTNRCHGGTAFECPYYTACRAGWTYPTNEYEMDEYYYRRCAKQIAGEARCNREMEHEGECDENLHAPARPRDIVIVPEDDPYYMGVTD